MAVAAAAAVAGLAGCAGQGGHTLAKRDVQGEIDEGKVVAVNQWARSHGAVIRWINMPVKKTALAGN
jgi:hypothetical protein